MKTFSNRIKRTALLLIVLALEILMTFHQGLAQNGNGNGQKPDPVSIVNPLPLPVTGSVGITGTPTVNVQSSDANPIIVKESQVQNAFSSPPLQISIAAAGPSAPPDPSGTRYAITSVTLDNGTNFPQTLSLAAVAVGVVTSNSCRFPANQQASAAGPTLRAPAQSTVQLTFPTPFITDAVNGTVVCLVASGTGGVGSTWSAVGYKILP